MSFMVDDLKSVACSTIDRCATELNAIGRAIWNSPEIGNEEREAHRILTSFFKANGFDDVDEHFVLDTAFRAKSGRGEGPNVAIICEYDALPDIGHACGHNLIAQAGAAAGIAVKAVLDKNPHLNARLTILGTPAEESSGGKIDLIKAGAFDDVDAAMMVHPNSFSSTTADFLSIHELLVTFTGKAAHAAAFPWEGVNALDAAVAAYNGISMLRQQMKPTWRAHGIFTEGGIRPNIIPHRSQMDFYLRAPNDKELDVLIKKSINVFEASARAHGCEVEIEDISHFSNLLGNSTLMGSYAINAKSIGMEMDIEDGIKPAGSTDMGNVSYSAPSMHPMFSIGNAAKHTRAFAGLANTEHAYERTLVAAKAMAMTAIDVLTNSTLRESVKADFKAQLDEARA